MLSLAEAKTSARCKAKALRSQIHRTKSSECSIKISEHLEKFLISRKELKIVAVYMPIQTEIDIRPVFVKIRALKRVLCLPVIVSDNKPLNFKVWIESAKLVKGKFNVLVPLTENFVEPDLILCPMLSFDTKGYRLGYGGGFYDRSIAHLTKKKSVFVLGCAYSEQLSSEKLPCGQYDKPLNAVATENGLDYFTL